jgi:hypothetical protein
MKANHLSIMIFLLLAFGLSGIALYYLTVQLGKDRSEFAANKEQSILRTAKTRSSSNQTQATIAQNNITSKKKTRGQSQQGVSLREKGILNIEGNISAEEEESEGQTNQSWTKDVEAEVDTSIAIPTEKILNVIRANARIIEVLDEKEAQRLAATQLVSGTGPDEMDTIKIKPTIHLSINGNLLNSLDSRLNKSISGRSLHVGIP